MDFESYEYLLFSRPRPGVLLVTINRPEKLNAANRQMTRELVRVWRDVSDDAETNIAVITGAGKAFCAGGDLEEEYPELGQEAAVATTMRLAYDLVYSIVNCEKPIIAAVNGVAVGAGLATALVSDICIIAEEVSFTDGHLRIGIAAGDHAAMVWPLMCGVARAKYLLLTADFITGREAERIGLVSRCVPRAELMDEALDLAERLANAPQMALRWTKRAVNNWYRQASPIFEASLGYEMMNLFGADVQEGFGAFVEKRPPVFPSAAGSRTDESP